MPSIIPALAAGLLAIVGAAQASLSPVFMEFTPAASDMKVAANISSTASYSQTVRQHVIPLNEDSQELGRIEVHWQFATIDTSCDGGCGSIPCLCPVPRDLIWFEWYDHGASSPTCTEQMDITVDSLRNEINGKMYYSQNCDIYAIFDGPNPNEGAVQTYTSGHGVDCGWVTSPDHTSNPGLLSLAEDFYHHCYWTT